MQPTRVLLADDSTPARAGLRALLATWPQFTVVGEAENGQEALRLAAECRPDVALIDLRMPVLDGVQTIREIKRRWPAIVVIALTVYVADRQDAIDAGADLFLVKGGSFEILLDALKLQVGAHV